MADRERPSSMARRRQPRPARRSAGPLKRPPQAGSRPALVRPDLRSRSARRLRDAASRRAVGQCPALDRTLSLNLGPRLGIGSERLEAGRELLEEEATLERFRGLVDALRPRPSRGVGEPSKTVARLLVDPNRGAHP